MQQMELPISVSSERIKYAININPAANGFAVMVEEVIKPRRTLTMDELQKQGDAIKQIQDSMNGDDILNRIRAQHAKKNQAKNKPSFLGLHVFPTYPAMRAFIDYVYEEEISEQEKFSIAGPAPLSETTDNS